MTCEILVSETLMWMSNERQAWALSHRRFRLKGSGDGPQLTFPPEFLLFAGPAQSQDKLSQVDQVATGRTLHLPSLDWKDGNVELLGLKILGF